ncbi:hypothetical protein AVEN_146133-1 [Araneus ventricosus]|uniref:Uncharacterized protein n=1 Tax=Araneus ventricosus TaxID=182803 RepID=A0A4Y2KNG9_ARAVE|nr:hypothetical protein AVEN_146133-1 [Araneus ventricosus]
MIPKVPLCSLTVMDSSALWGPLCEVLSLASPLVSDVRATPAVCRQYQKGRHSFLMGTLLAGRKPYTVKDHRSRLTASNQHHGGGHTTAVG